MPVPIKGVQAQRVLTTRGFKDLDYTLMLLLGVKGAAIDIFYTLRYLFLFRT